MAKIKNQFVPSVTEAISVPGGDVEIMPETENDSKEQVGWDVTVLYELRAVAHGKSVVDLRGMVHTHCPDTKEQAESYYQWFRRLHQAVDACELAAQEAYFAVLRKG